MRAVERAWRAVTAMGEVSDAAISASFNFFAAYLEDDGLAGLNDRLGAFQNHLFLRAT